MKIVAAFVIVLLSACTPNEERMYRSSANVNVASIPAMLSAIDDLTENELAVDEFVTLTNSLSMDEEKQKGFVATHKGNEAEVNYHVWREQADWVHVTLSSTSEQMIHAIDGVAQEFARAADE